MKAKWCVLGLLPFLLSCDRSRGAASNQEQLTVGFSYFQDTMLPLVAEWNNWYEEEGLNVRLVALDWAAIPAALANGDVDVAIGNICAVVGAHHRIPQLRYVYGFNTFDNGFALLVRPTGNWRYVEDFTSRGVAREAALDSVAAQLRGRTVVTTSGTDMEQGVAAAAARAGLRFGEDVRIIDLDPDEGLAAFLAGQGDAYIGGIPQRLRATQEGARPLLVGRDLGPAEINGYIALEGTFRERSEEIQKLLGIWFRTVQAIESDSSLARRIVTELNRNSGGNFTVADFWRFFNNIEHYPPHPQAVQADILGQSGGNYWRRRWDSCNSYFSQIVPPNSPQRIPAPVPYTASMIDTVQTLLLQRYGTRTNFLRD